MFQNQKHIFDDFLLDGKTYRPLSVCTQKRARETAGLFKSKGYSELLWIPIDEKNLDGYICFEITSKS